MNRFMIAMLLAGTSALAQDKAKTTPPPAEKGDVVVLVRLKYADPETVTRLLSNAGVNLRDDRTLHMLVISGDPDRVRRAKEIAEEIDVPGSAGVMPPGALPSSDLEFTVYMLAGQSKGDASIGVPKALDGTVSQLRAIFPYASYHLLDTAVLRVGGDSGGEVRGFLPPIGEATDSGSYSIAAVVRGVVPKEHESEISVREFHCFLNLPDGHNGRFDVNVKTTLELREGQQVVVGKAGMGNAGTLFVVVSARVLK